MDPIEQELTKKLSDLHPGKLTNTPLTRGNTSWELEQELARKLIDVRNPGSRLSTRAVNLPISLLQTKDLLIWEKERSQVMGLPETGTDLVLRGYKLFFVEEWLWSNKRPWSLVMDAGAMDSIRVRKYALPKLSAVQQKRTVKGLALNEQGFTLKQTEHGSISVYSESNPLGYRCLPLTPHSLPLVQCPDGDFDRYVSEFSAQLSLKRLSCCDTINFVGTVSRDNFIDAYREYLPEATTAATVDRSSSLADFTFSPTSKGE